MATIYTPESFIMVYTLDEVKKSFAQYQLSQSEKPLLTPLIRRELNRGYNSTTGAENLIKIRDQSDWSKCTITGLRPLGDGYYYADLPINGKKSFVVCYTDDWETLYLCVTPQFYPFVQGDRPKYARELARRIAQHREQKP